MRKSLIPLIALFLLLFTSALTFAQEPQKTAEASAQAEQPKNEVETKIEELRKQGETVMGACIQNCGEDGIADGVDKGRALLLPKPPYPRVARMAHVAGTVEVQVLIGLDGKVMAAAAISGHPLLYATCLEAARGSVFTTTKLDGKPVLVTGIIQYNFMAQ